MIDCGIPLPTMLWSSGQGTVKHSASLSYALPTSATAQSSIWERIFLGRKISKQRIQRVGGVFQCHGVEKEEATGDGAVGKEEYLVGKKYSNWGTGARFQSSVPLEIFTPLT